MDLIDILAVAVALGADAMSVCMGIGVRWHGPRQKFRMAWHMGLFQFLMPIIGWLAGNRLRGLLDVYGKYIAAALVFAVGAKMLYEAVRSHPGAAAEKMEDKVDHAAGRSDPTRGWSLMVLSVATSLDALVVGFSLALRGQVSRDIWWTSLVIGLVAGAMSLTGVIIGKRVGQALGKWAEIAGGLVLVILAATFIWL